MPIISTNIVAFLLLNKFRDGCTLDKLVEAFDLMRQELEFGDKNIAWKAIFLSFLAFCGESVDIIKQAVGRTNKRNDWDTRKDEQTY